MICVTCNVCYVICDMQCATCNVRHVMCDMYCMICTVWLRTGWVSTGWLTRVRLVLACFEYFVAVEGDAGGIPEESEGPGRNVVLAIHMYI